jgi:cell division protease FtsH
MDGFDVRNGMIILAATNRPEVLDPALLRAGRFDRQILVDRADLAGRKAILEIHTAQTSLGRDVELDKVAALTPGFTGADLANLVNEATLLATRRESEAVSMQDFTAAIERIVAGLEKKNRLLNEKERRRVAYHELGHAFAAQALPGADPVHKVSIIPRGIGALGYTIQRPTEDRFLMSQSELENKIVVLLAGRAAEVLVFGDASTGAADDFAKATDIARAMVTKYGMHPELGLVSYDDPAPAMLTMPGMPTARADYSEATAQRIDTAVREILDAAFEKGTAILELNQDLLHDTAEVLLTRETLNESELPALRGLAEERPAA